MIEQPSEQRTRELEALHAMALAIGASLTLDEIATASMRSMLDASQADLTFLFLRDGDRLTLHTIMPPEGSARLGIVPEHRVGECLCGLAVQQARPIFCQHIDRDTRCTWEECKRAGIRSFAALPLKSGETIIGVIGLASLVERDFSSQSAFLETMSHQVAMAVANARLYQTVQRELAERRQAEERLRLTQFAVDQAGEAIFFITSEARFSYVNEVACRSLGYSRQELQAMTVHDIDPVSSVEA